MASQTAQGGVDVCLRCVAVCQDEHHWKPRHMTLDESVYRATLANEMLCQKKRPRSGVRIGGQFVA